MEMLQFSVVALKFDSLDAELVALGGSRNGLGRATLTEVTFAQRCQRDIEARSQHTVDVLTIDAVNGLPFDVDETRVTHNHVVIG